MKILIAGDSLGLPRPHRINSFNPLEETELAVHYEETYGFLLNHELASKYPHRAIHVINRAQRFYTIKNIFDQFADHLFFFQPDLIVIHVGIVDCWYRENLGGKQMVPLHEFTNIYNNMIQMMNQRPETKVIFIGICRTSKKMADRYPGILDEIKIYNEVLRSRVDHNKTFFIEMEQHIDPDDPHVYLLPDDCHLNKQGNLLIQEKLQVLIEAFIENQEGALLFNSTNNEKQNVLNRFRRSFEIHPYYMDNLYNLLVLAYELENYNLLDQVVQYIFDHKIQEPDLMSLLKMIKGNMQR